MTDVIDQAQQFEAINLQQALDVQREKAKHTPTLTARDTCHNCEEPFADGRPRLFCDAACADEHARDERLRLQSRR